MVSNLHISGSNRVRFNSSLVATLPFLHAPRLLSPRWFEVFLRWNASSQQLSHHSLTWFLRVWDLNWQDLLGFFYQSDPLLSITTQDTPIYTCSLERKKFKHFVLNKYFCLVLGQLKSKISKKSTEGFQSYCIDMGRRTRDDTWAR